MIGVHTLHSKPVKGTLVQNLVRSQCQLLQPTQVAFLQMLQNTVL
jgi:hypothetical protein